MLFRPRYRGSGSGGSARRLLNILPPEVSQSQCLVRQVILIAHKRNRQLGFNLVRKFIAKTVVSRQPIACVALVVSVLLLPACDRDKAKVYKVPKENEAPPAQATAAAPSAPGQAGQAGQAPIHWDVPAGWQEKNASGMRAGSFSASGANGEEADISVIPLTGTAGGELSNVNRWRNQVNLPPITEAELAAHSTPVQIAGETCRIYDMVGTGGGGQAGASEITAAMVDKDGVTWFFKMTGPQAVVSAQKDAFKKLLESVSFGGGAAAHPPMAAMPAPGMPSGGGLPPAEVKGWQAPSEWQPQSRSDMRVASYVVRKDGDAADVSVVALAGEGGGVLGNVNRWRGQVSLAPVSEAELPAQSTPLDLSGTHAMLFDMTGTDKGTGEPVRMLAVIVPRDGRTWFYKMMGPAKLVGAEKENFEQFVKQAQFPND